MKPRLMSQLFLLCCLVALTAVAWSQSPTTGGIAGQVLDPQGAAVAGATVVLQYKLGAKNAGTFDVGCACASFPTGLSAAAGIIAANPGIKTVLVIGVYLMHKLTSAADPMIFFYGDGAGAAVLEPAASPGFITSNFRADGSYHDYWGIYSGGTFEPASEDSVKAGRTVCAIKNRYPPELNEETWPLIVHRLAKDGVSICVTSIASSLPRCGGLRLNG
jgi:hypothetical protein